MIGILAGMGPKSTAPFVELVVAQCQQVLGARHDLDFPPMLIYSLPTPFYVDRPVDHAALQQAIVGGLRKLESTGAWFIAMPCNTAHAYFDALAASISIPLLNIVQETISAIPPGITRLALLATQATVDSRVYQGALGQSGHELHWRPAIQSQVDRLILAVKAGRALPELAGPWHELLHQLEAARVDGAIVACTDLAVLSTRLEAARPEAARSGPALPLVDSALALARATVVEYARRRST